jgi:hypothetical protein
MPKPKDQDPGDAGLVLAAYNTHDERCGPPPRLRNTDSQGLYYGSFENRSGEQFVFTFERATGAGTVSGGDLGRDARRSFTPGRREGAVPGRDQVIGLCARPAAGAGRVGCAESRHAGGPDGS